MTCDKILQRKSLRPRIAKYYADRPGGCQYACRFKLLQPVSFCPPTLFHN